MSLHHLALALSAAALAGCSSYHLVTSQTPPLDLRAPPPAGMGRVCVLRPQRDASAVTFPVRDNDQLVGATLGSGYFCYLAEPGEHHITSEAEGRTSEAWANVEPGRAHYLNQAVVSTFQAVEVELRWVDERAGLEMIKDRPYRMLVSGPGKEGPVEPMPIAHVRQAKGGAG